ncbi:hypothetical protein BaRGS_00018655 [Batillaria attramentaria]|uniref:Endothelin-converting enzyme 1 n=1 Tax=Batillaria attramentaria TaxID=370345 RepID=A0ABD0KS92_9CAEN
MGQDNALGDGFDRLISIDLSGIGLPLRYYTGAQYDKGRTDYKTFIRTVATLLLRDAELNITDAEKTRRVEQFVSDAFDVESEIASLKESAQSTPNPHSMDQRMTLQEINTQTGGVVNWVDFFMYMFNRAPVNGNTPVVVLEKEYLLKFTEWIKTELEKNSRDFKRKLHNYLVWRLSHRYVQDLSWEYIHANRQIYVDLTGVAEFLGTWRYCVSKIDRDMYEALGALFAHEITDYIRNALVESLRSRLHWMSQQTRDTAVKKVQDSIMKLGYPDYMMNEHTLDQIYSSLTISKTDYFSNLLSFNTFFKDEWNNHLASPGDTSVWVYSTYSFVAQYYNPWKELIVPAGLLQFPIYDHKSPHYMNFGSMGAIVGRQLVHAVDVIANNYRLDGAQFGTWWSNQTIEEYEKVKQCIVDAYKDVVQGPYEVFGDSYPVSVDMDYYAPIALGESSGVKLALRAYKDWMAKTGGEKKMPGPGWTNEQSFFVAYAQALSRPYAVQENVQVNQALAQLQEFQDAFQCTDSSKMVAPKRCQLY